MSKNSHRIAYLGPEGSFSHEAAIAKFPSFKMIKKDTLEDVFDSAFVDEVDYAIMPVENSTEGIIALTYHKLVEQGRNPAISIQGEIYHNISHNLGAIDSTTLDTIQYIHTKPEVWGQCRVWASRNLPHNVEFIPESSSSRGVQIVAEKGDSHRVAIGSVLAMNIFKIKPIVRCIQDHRDNSTRFFIIGRRPFRKSNKTNRYKVTLGLVLLDRIGSISETFGVFAKNGVDVRSVKVSPVRAPEIVHWKDWFFIDVLENEANLTNVLQTIEELRNKEGLVLTIRQLGRYPSGHPEERPKKDFELPTMPVNVGAPGGLSLEDIISAGEGINIEFKTTLRWNVKDGKPDKEMEFAVLKTIIGFMNARGGVLVVGVEDDGKIHGLAEDFGTLTKQSKDGFELHLHNIIQRSIGSALSHLVDTRFVSKEQKDVCIVSVQPSPSPVWVQREGKNDFYVRSGNQTKPFDNKETADYIRFRWSSFSG